MASVEAVPERVEASPGVDLVGTGGPTEPGARDVGELEPRKAARRWGRSLAAGLAVAALIVLVRDVDLLVGPSALVVAVVLVLAIPTSPVLSRRILLAMTVALGWVPVLWWWDLPVGSAGRVTLLLAVVAGGLAAWCAASTQPSGVWRSLLPRLAVVDALPPVAALGAAAYLAPWLRPASPEAALSMLMVGWDNSAHYDMVALIRRYGVVVAGVPAPTDGTEWSYVGYPQGFHAAAAAMMELLHGPALRLPGAEVLTYTVVLGLLAVGLVLVVTAGLCALPGLRARPAVALPVVALAASALVLGPGGSSLADGFPNFLLACGLLCCVPLLVIPARRCVDPLTVVALGGALVGIAHGWLLLLVMALPAAAALVLPWSRTRFRAPRVAWSLVAAGVVATALAGLMAVRAIAGQDVADVLVIPGSGPSLSTLELAVAVGLAVAGPVSLVVAFWRRPWEPAAVRALAQTVALISGAGFAAWIAWLQLRSTGVLGYYFWKFATAVALLAIVTGLAAVASSVRGSREGSGRDRTRHLARLAPWAASGLALVVFGAPHPWVQSAVLPGSRGLAARVAVAMSAADPAEEAVRVLAAAGAPTAGTGLELYVPTGTDGRPNPGSTAQWYGALAGAWTEESNALAMLLVQDDLTVDVTAFRIREVLLSDPRVTVVVPPEHLRAVLDALPEGVDANRVRSW